MVVDEFVDELFALDVKDFFGRIVGHDIVADGVHQVSFAESGAAVKEKRIEIAAALLFGDGHAGGMGEAVAAADDKRVEGVLRN